MNKNMNKNALAFLENHNFSSLSEYYDSKMWSDFRNKLVKLYRETGKWNCWACKCGGDRFDLHHIDYDNLGKFNIREIDDIKVLCKPCHSAVHEINRTREMTLRQATHYVLEGKLLKEQRANSVIKRVNGVSTYIQRSPVTSCGPF